MDYSQYSNILEFIPDENSLDKLSENTLFKYLSNYFDNKKINNVLLSLSGGVDSMVVCIMCKLLKIKNKSFDFYCVHLNYNNRKESIDESNFLIDWCKYHGIYLDVLNIDHIHRGECNRNEYEEETRNIRYKFYKDSIDKFNCSGVILAHHKDDYSENVFNNIMRGQNSITNLGVFKEDNIIHDVRVLRPLLNFRKDKIYEISSEYQVPYFLDTTPDWSCRGQMRNDIFPKCDKCYGDIFMNNLHKIGKQSEDINLVFNKFILEPILGKVLFGKYGFIIPKSDELKQQIILENVIDNITFKLGLKTVKRKGISNLIDKMNESNYGELHLVSGLKCFLLDSCIICLKLEEIISILNSIKEISDKYLSNFIFVNDVEKDIINGILYFKSNNKKLRNLLSIPIGKYIPVIKNINIEEGKIIKINISN